MDRAGDRAAELARRMEMLRLSGLPPQQRRRCGIGPIDRLLGGGVRLGSLVAWHGWGRGHGATTLALRMARGVCGGQKRLVVVERESGFYPPAAVAWGIRPDEMIIVRCTTAEDELWSVEQALRCRAVGAVLAWPKRLNDRQLRRWQLAAERAGSVGLLVRDGRRQRGGYAVETCLYVRPLAGQHGCWRFRVERLRGRNRSSGACVHLEIDEATGTIRETLPGGVVAELADSTSAGRTTVAGPACDGASRTAQLGVEAVAGDYLLPASGRAGRSAGHAAG